MTEGETTAIRGYAVVLFDGRCGLCNGLVRFAIKRDRARRMRYIPQESRLGLDLMRLVGIPVAPGQLADGVIFVEDALEAGQRVSMRSDSVGRMLRILGGVWAAVGRAMEWVPGVLRELGYSLVARWRYQVFGMFATCPVPTAEQRELILGFGTTAD